MTFIGEFFKDKKVDDNVKIVADSKLSLPQSVSSGPCPMHEVVVMAVSAAVTAATMTFSITSQMFFLFMMFN